MRRERRWSTAGGKTRPVSAHTRDGKLAVWLVFHSQTMTDQQLAHAIGEDGDFAAIPFFQQAVELDPKFAMAHLMLGTEFWNFGESAQARPSLESAFALRDRVSTKEGFHIAHDSAMIEELVELIGCSGGRTK